MGFWPYFLQDQKSGGGPSFFNFPVVAFLDPIFTVTTVFCTTFLQKHEEMEAKTKIVVLFFTQKIQKNNFFPKGFEKKPTFFWKHHLLHLGLVFLERENDQKPPSLPLPIIFFFLSSSSKHL